jgi:hypothetical protein
LQYVGVRVGYYLYLGFITVVLSVGYVVLYCPLAGLERLFRKRRQPPAPPPPAGTPPPAKP